MDTFVCQHWRVNFRDGGGELRTRAAERRSKERERAFQSVTRAITASLPENG